MRITTTAKLCLIILPILLATNAQADRGHRSRSDHHVKKHHVRSHHGHRHHRHYHRHHGHGRSHKYRYHRRRYHYSPKSYRYSYRYRYPSSYSNSYCGVTEYREYRSIPKSYDTYGTSSYTTDFESAWTALERGADRKALRRFAELASTYPDHGMPKVGYALATGFRGDHERAVWAMRRAFRIDPYGINNPSGSSDIMYRISDLTDHFESVSQGNHDNAHDIYFMVASLHYLQGNYDRARSAVSEAIALGDKAASTKNLEMLLYRDL